MMVDASAATQSSELEAPFIPVTPSFDVRLTVVSSGAKIIQSGGNELEVQQDEMVEVQVEEGIKVVKSEGQDEQSYSILDFADALEVELLSDTSVVLAGLRQEEDGSSYANLHLSSGHLFVHLTNQTNSGITIQTLYATIRALTGGAEFDVCQTEALTCILVKKGVIEVTPQNGRVFLIKPGEALTVLKDQRPSPPICAPLTKFISWEEEYRQFADAASLEYKLSELPQEPCPLNAAGIPVDARILYQDEFRNPFGKWERGRIGDFTVRYAGLRFFRIQAQNANVRHLAPVPNEQIYEDANIDIQAIAAAASGGDFRYGITFRRTGSEFYAFVISPVTKTWYFLKNSSSGPEILKEGKEERIDGLDSREALRVEAYGSMFFIYINGRFIDSISDAAYASGEVALFVETLQNPDAEVRFDSIIIWDMTAVVINPNVGGREYCFNTFDDDGDRLIDRADPDCQRLGKTATPAPLSTSISVPATSTTGPTNTSIPPTSEPTNTLLPPHTSTPRPPTRTRIPPTATQLPPTATNVPPTATNVPPTDIPPTDIPPTDIPPTDIPPTDIPPTDPPPTDPPTDEPTEEPTEPPTP